MTAPRETIELEAPARVEAPHAGDAARLRGRTSRLAIKGSLWIVLGLGVSQILRLASNVALTKFLDREVFGLMLILGAVLSGMQMMSDIGIAPSIIQNPRGNEPIFRRTAWTVQVLRGVLLAVVAALIAVPIGWFYQEPRLTLVLPVAALTAAIGGFGATAAYTLNRKLAMGRLTLLDLGSQVVGIIVMLAWAWRSPTVWALVAGGLSVTLVRTIGSHFLDRSHRDGFGIERQALAALLHFGGWVFVSTLLTFFAGQSDRLVFGKLIPLELLGVYSIAMNLSSLPLQIIARLGDSIAFPALSATVREGGDLDGAVRRIRTPLTVAGVCVATGVGVVGPWFIHLLYDSRYADGEWIVRILAIAGVFQVLEALSGSVLMAVGGVKWIAAANGAKVVGIVVLIPLGFHSWGFPGALAGWVAAEGVKYLLCAVGAQKHNARILWQDARLCAWTGAVAALAIAWERLWIGDARHSLGLACLQSVTIVIGFAPLLWPLLSELRRFRAGAAGSRSVGAGPSSGSAA